MSEIEPRQIIEVLGGCTQVARMLGIQPPSVHYWVKTSIPEGRLIELAARIEVSTNGAFSRKTHWPEKFHLIWPELVKTKT